MARARRLSATAPATRRAARGPHTPPKLPQSALAAPTAGARVRRPLRPGRPVWRHARANRTGTDGTRRWRCGGAETCASAANGAR